VSVRWITWAWEQPCTSSGEKLTLIALADHAGEDGVCWPSSGRLTEKTGLSRRAIFGHLANLESEGLLAREQRFREDGGQTSSVICLGVQDRDGGVQNLHGGYAPEIRGAMQPVAPPVEPSVEPSVEPTPPTPQRGEVAVTDDGFDAFWAVYPRGGGKPAARRAWKSALKKVAVAEIADGLQMWLDHWHAAGTPQNYIPMPATWLNQERWNDTPPPLASRDTKSARSQAAIERLARGETDLSWLRGTM
jgi:hypothetical protein